MTTSPPEQREQAPPRPQGAKRRGRETALDMLRSLGLVLLVVVPLWFLAQPGPGAEQEIRVVDQSADLAAWTSSEPGAPVPGAQRGWQPTVSQLLRAPVGLRLGWVTPGGGYAEFAATTGPAEPFLEAHVGDVPSAGDVVVAGVPWQQYREDDGSVSLVREVDGVTVVVGTRRATAQLDEVTALAASVTTSAP